MVGEVCTTLISDLMIGPDLALKENKTLSGEF